MLSPCCCVFFLFFFSLQTGCEAAVPCIVTEMAECVIWLLSARASSSSPLLGRIIVVQVFVLCCVVLCCTVLCFSLFLPACLCLVFGPVRHYNLKKRANIMK